VVRIRAIEPIENADAIEVAVVGDYRSIVRKGQYLAGELAVYIPEDSIVPIDLIRYLGLEGRLAGKDKNRVKAVKLRGTLSQGLLYKVHPEYGEHRLVAFVPESNGTQLHTVIEGQDVAELLTITKYEPIIPSSMSGDVYNAGRHLTVQFDIENYKKYPDVIADGEEVVMTEKLHGTFFGIGILPDHEYDPKHVFGKYVLFSKGLGAQGLCFKLSEKSEQTVYLKAAEKCGLFDALETAKSLLESEETEQGFDRPLYLLGEVFGGSIQDAGWYSNDISFRLFAVVSGYNQPSLYSYFDYDQVVALAKLIGVETVPILYRGPFSKEVMLQYTTGKETVSGKERNIREGLVVVPTKERTHPAIGRVALKSVSEDYLTRKGNTTEYQ
jgi:RNA ligase (TIGR02306 family)